MHFSNSMEKFLFYAFFMFTHPNNFNYTFVTPTILLNKQKNLI
ncbi:hypothetical protein M23134_07124 [Microscilla marina ATCC 23134]|uniref:Uncharacterized protein n=1 Tax=Microscilla marina ATCC 23134 TaxID=313606 RepID=A1ZUF6_MICM2|nr:hypothetical protein M23134_07124 [Microscilla marina ATCC 23134]